VSTIWAEPEVARIVVVSGTGQPQLLLGDLLDDDRGLVLRFIDADQRATPEATTAEFARACVAGIAAVDRLSAFSSIGWKLFVLHLTGINAATLWERSRDPHAVAVAMWTIETLAQNAVHRDRSGSALDRTFDTCHAIIEAAGATGNGQTADSARAWVTELLPPELDSPAERTYEFMDYARQAMEPLIQILQNEGLAVSTIDVGMLGVGVAVHLEDDLYAVVATSANGSKPSLTYITSGVRHSITAPEPLVLDTCNRINLEGKLATCVFYPGDAGDAVIARAGLPAAALQAIPAFFTSVVRETAYFAHAGGGEFRSRGVSGRQFEWTLDDVTKLATIICS
jgi:hypothetical protein